MKAIIILSVVLSAGVWGFSALTHEAAVPTVSKALKSSIELRKAALAGI